MAKSKKKIGKRDFEKIAQQCVKQIETAFRFKQPRMEEVLMNEDLYHGAALPRLRGRFSVPLPTMGGYVDTFLSKTDEAGTITYANPDDRADEKAVDLSNRVAQKVLRDRKMRWNAKDRNQKKLAAFSGVGIGEFFTEGGDDVEYKNHYNVIDHFDFGCEPMGGCSLENHQFCGRINLFKGQWELEDGAESGFYDADQVDKLMNSVDDDKKRKNKELYQNKVQRFQRYGLDIESHDFLGENVYNLTWWGTTYKGKRYLVTLDYETGIWIRVKELEEVDESGLWPWTSWATHPDEFNFWSKAPCDDIRPVAVSIDILFNQALDNRQKRNFGMRAFDPSIFPNPEELEWRPDGIVEATTTGGLKQISQGIYEFETPEVSGTVDMIQFMDSYLGRKTGINDGAQGDTEEKKVGIFYGELQQVADRLGYYNKSYSEFHEDIGVRILWGMKQHLDEETAQAMLGLEGVETDLILADMIKPEWDVEVSGGQAEFRENMVKKQKREETITKLMSSQSLAAKINPEWVIRQMLLNAEYDEEDITEALDLADNADSESIGEAELAIQKMLKGEEVALNRGATVAYVKHIFRFAQSTTFSKDPKKDIVMYTKLVDFARKNLPIAQENAIFLANELRIRNQILTAMNPAPAGGEAVPGKGPTPRMIAQGAPAPTPIGSETDEPAPGTEGGTIQRSQEIAAAITP